MEYHLFVGDNCHECDEVERDLAELNVEINIHNIDRGTIKPPIPTFAFPALFKGEILLAYGSDIVQYLKKRVEQ